MNTNKPQPQVSDYLAQRPAFTIRLLSRFYPFTPEQWEKHRFKLDTLLLGKNPNLIHCLPESLKPLIELFDLTEEEPQETEATL